MATTETRPAPTGAGLKGITIPKGCKPSKAVSTDWTHPNICHAYLRRHKGALYLCATDSFIAVALRVEGDADEGYVPIGALRLMETGKTAEQLSPTAWKVTTPEGFLTFDVGRGGNFPDFAGLGVWDKPDSGTLDAVGMNTTMMHRIGQALGARNGCRMEFVGPLRPIWVTPLSFDVGVALQMPIRLDI